MTPLAAYIFKRDLGLGYDVRAGSIILAARIAARLRRIA